MKRTRLLFLSSSLLGGLALALTSVACGDDDAIVRERPDAGGDVATVDGGDTDTGTLGCGVTIPATYESTGFTQNASVELALKASLEALEDKMKEAEGATPVGTPTTADLTAIYAQGTPSLRAVSTANAQTLVDQYLAHFGDAVGKTWAPADADNDAGAAPTGGKYEDTFLFGPTGIDLRETTGKVILTGALYNHALGIVAAPLTAASVDRLLAIFGASPSLANRTDADAGELADELIAEYASRRDDDNAATGPYRKIKQALLTLKAAVPAGDKCKKEVDEAVATYFAEWEKSALSTVIYYLNAAVTNATAGNKNPQALHGFGEALGFIQSWKGIPQEKRKITDAQVDALLTKVGADSPYKLVLQSTQAARVLSINGAINDIAAIYGFSAAEVEAFKKNF